MGLTIGFAGAPTTGAFGAWECGGTTGETGLGAAGATGADETAGLIEAGVAAAFTGAKGEGAAADAATLSEEEGAGFSDPPKTTFGGVGWTVGAGGKRVGGAPKARASFREKGRGSSSSFSSAGFAWETFLVLGVSPSATDFLTVFLGDKAVLFFTAFPPEAEADFSSLGFFLTLLALSVTGWLARFPGPSNLRGRAPPKPRVPVPGRILPTAKEVLPLRTPRVRPEGRPERPWRIQ